MRPFLLAAAMALLLSACATPDGGGPALVTVAGAIAAPDRGPVGAEDDKFFAYQEDSFATARRFDVAALRALPQATVRADFPKGGDVRVFEGPRLADVLAAAGASGATVTVKALDGYAIEAPAEELAAKGAVLALKRDGKFLNLGDYGPTHLVFPRAERRDLAEMSDDWWVWTVYLVTVE